MLVLDRKVSQHLNITVYCDSCPETWSPAIHVDVMLTCTTYIGITADQVHPGFSQMCWANKSDPWRPTSKHTGLLLTSWCQIEQQRTRQVVIMLRLICVCVVIQRLADSYVCQTKRSIFTSLIVSPSSVFFGFHAEQISCLCFSKKF